MLSTSTSMSFVPIVGISVTIGSSNLSDIVSDVVSGAIVSNGACDSTGLSL